MDAISSSTIETGQFNNNDTVLGNSNYLYAPKYNLKDAVKLPLREDRSEWMASNIFDFHKQICMLFGTINDDCTPSSCPKMIASEKFRYAWSSDRGPVELSAPEYIHHLLDWVQDQLDDEETFPRSDDKKFPANFFETCQTICKRLLRVYAHIYHHHLTFVKKLTEEAHMNTSFKHFIYFIQEFGLVPAGSEDLEPLTEQIRKLT